ncbi:MAG: CGNR zinc finger domain-containing protein [Catenulispora sp.]|nr:CGNR zinc finger domain-containing protein [Catenulispora sp.]
MRSGLGWLSWRGAGLLNAELIAFRVLQCHVETAGLVDAVHDCRSKIEESGDLGVTSPPGSRRWCAMGRCGNQEKNRAYRSRKTADGAAKR